MIKIISFTWNHSQKYLTFSKNPWKPWNLHWSINTILIVKMIIYVKKIIISNSKDLFKDRWLNILINIWTKNSTNFQPTRSNLISQSQKKKKTNKQTKTKKTQKQNKTKKQQQNRQHTNVPSCGYSDGLYLLVISTTTLILTWVSYSFPSSPWWAPTFLWFPLLSSAL